MPELLPPLPEDWERGMCVAAHPDDIEYGASSAVARWTAQGKSITYLLATRGEAGIDAIHPADAAPLREAEEREGARRVGVEVVDFLDYSDGVVESTLALRRDIARAIRRHRPEVILTGSFDVRGPGEGFSNQADHRAVGLATLDAARDAGNRWIFSELLGQGLEPWAGVRFVAVLGTNTPSHGVDVSGEPLRRGIRSLEAHAAYTQGLGGAAFDVADFLQYFAALGGAALGVEHAVLLDLYRLRPEGPPPWAAIAAPEDGS